MPYPPEVRLGYCDGQRGLSIGQEELFLYVKRLPGGLRLQLRDLHPAGHGSTAWVTIDDPEKLRTSPRARPIRDLLRETHPEVHRQVLEQVIKALEKNAEEWPREEEEDLDINQLIEHTLQHLQAVELRPPIDYHPDIGIIYMAPLFLGDHHQTLILTPLWISLAQNELCEIPEEFANYIQLREAKKWEMTKTYSEQILLASRELRNNGYIASKPLSEVFDDALLGIKEYYYISDERWLVALTCWVIGTYLHPIFDVYPILHVQGERESGKSTLLRVLSRLCWNATDPEASLREAVLFRTIEASRPTYLVDATRLDPKYGTPPDVIEVFEMGYMKGGRVRRCNRETLEVESFEVYGPKAIASRAELPFEAKCIRLISEKAKDPAYTERSIHILEDPRFDELVGDLLRSALTTWREIHEAYRELHQTERLRGRRFQLWRPLLAICRVYAQDRYEELLSLAEEDALTWEPGDRQSEVEDALLTVLVTNIEECSSWLLKELTEKVQELLPWVRTYHPVKAAITNLGIAKRRYKTGRGVAYQLCPERVRRKAEERGIKAEEEATEEPSSLGEKLKEAYEIGLRLQREKGGEAITTMEFYSALKRELGLEDAEIKRLLDILMREGRCHYAPPNRLRWICQG